MATTAGGQAGTGGAGARNACHDATRARSPLVPSQSQPRSSHVATGHASWPCRSPCHVASREGERERRAGGAPVGTCGSSSRGSIADGDAAGSGGRRQERDGGRRFREPQPNATRFTLPSPRRCKKVSSFLVISSLDRRSSTLRAMSTKQNGTIDRHQIGSHHSVHVPPAVHVVRPRPCLEQRKITDSRAKWIICGENLYFFFV